MSNGTSVESTITTSIIQEVNINQNTLDRIHQQSVSYYPETNLTLYHPPTLSGKQIEFLQPLDNGSKGIGYNMLSVRRAYSGCMELFVELHDADSDNIANDLDDFPFDSTQTSDADMDGYGSATMMLTACEQPDGYVDNSIDCD